MRTRFFGKKAASARVGLEKTVCLTALAGILILTGCGEGKFKYDASGVFEATEVIVSAEAYGRILRFDVVEGMRLTTGQEVGYIDTVQLYLQKMQALTNKKSVMSRSSDISKQIAATREQIANAKYERQRNENLLKANATTQKTIDDIDLQIRVLESQLAAQLSTLEKGNQGVYEDSSAIDVQVAQLNDQLRKSRILSPGNGTVLVKYTEQGELATQGKPLFKMADLDSMFIRVYITSDQLSRIKLGQTVTVYADYGDKNLKPYDGIVTWISDKSEFTPKTIQTRDERANLVYAVKIAIRNDGYVKIGMYGEIRFQHE